MYIYSRGTRVYLDYMSFGYSRASLSVRVYRYQM